MKIELPGREIVVRMSCGHDQRWRVIGPLTDEEIARELEGGRCQQCIPEGVISFHGYPVIWDKRGEGEGESDGRD